jgi:hypothetical protein
MDKAIQSQIDQARQERDTMILQKVNLSHRMAFKQKFPGQIEHIMRLIAERLHHVLVDKPRELNNIDTWSATPAEILALCESLYYMASLNEQYKVKSQDADA